MAISSEKTAWLARFGIVDAAAADGGAAPGGTAAPAPVRMRSKSNSSSEETQSSSDEGDSSSAENESQSSQTAAYQEDHSYSGTITHTPPPAPPKPPAPPPRAPSPPARPPGPWADDAPPADGERPPGPWADQMDTPAEEPNASHEPNQSGGEHEGAEQEAGALGGHTPGVTEQFEFTLETHPVKAWGGKIEVAYKLTVQATAAFLPNEENQIQITYNSKEGMLKKAASSWPLEKVMKALGAPSVLNKSKFTVEGEMSDKGITIKAGFGIETSFGGGEISGVLVKIESGKTPAFGAIEIAYQTPKFVLADWVEENIQVGQVSLSVKAAASIEPQWVRMMAEELIKEAGIEAGAEAAATAAAETAVEGGAADAGGMSAAAVIEVAIPAALAAVAVGTALGVANMFIQKANMDDMKSGLAAAIRDFRGGLYDGLANATGSGSGELYTQGRALGSDAYQKAGAAFMAKMDRPPLPDEAPLIREAASKAVTRWSGWGQIENTLRWGFFNRWVDQNHGLGTFKGDAQQAVLWCFGVANEPSTGPHMKVWVEKSSLPDLLKE